MCYCICDYSIIALYNIDLIIDNHYARMVQNNKRYTNTIKYN